KLKVCRLGVATAKPNIIVWLMLGYTPFHPTYIMSFLKNSSFQDGRGLVLKKGLKSLLQTFRIILI
ncbi:hypothetical protein ACE1AT_05930, partial [Pelatocladus sp. BLCC-F211]|uniref:hypothetical protein n=1 Tax=Pelatocladus sp. BLCC-F211 TaxID=3342752 RepID=UPI0035B78060